MSIPDNLPEVASASRRKEVIGRIFGRGKAEDIEIIPETPEIPPEIEKGQTLPGVAQTLPKPVTDQGQVVVAPAEPPTPQIKLPLTAPQIQKGLTYDIVYSIRWLAEWCWRLIKKLTGSQKKKEL